MKSRTVPGYVSWLRMIQRCYNPSTDNYHRYGGRGIKVAPRWRVFKDFIADMGERPPGMQIDRYPNPDGDYEPGNCRWATPKEQARNRKGNRLVEYKGRSITVSEAAEIAGLDRRRVLQRLNAGWTAERAIESPLDVRKIHKVGDHLCFGVKMSHNPLDDAA